MVRLIALRPFDILSSSLDWLNLATGPVVRIGLNELSFFSLYAASNLFKIGKGFHKTDNYMARLHNGVKDIFKEIRENVHANKKRFAVPPYSIAAVQ